MKMDDPSTERRRLRSQKRAEARASYKELLVKTRSIGRDESPSKVQKVISENLTKSDELYNIVKKNLDGTLIDSKVVRQAVTLGNEAAKRINVTSRNFELKKAVMNLMKDAREQLGTNWSEDFNKFVVENHVNTFLNSAPTFEFFYGALKAEELEIKERKKRTREKIVESQAVTATERDIDVEVEQDTTPKEVEIIANQVKRLCQRRPSGYSFLKALVDPDSFSKTVENIFHTAFLVKEGEIRLKMTTNGGPVITLKEDSDGSQKVEQDASGQAILSFSMEDYKKWLTKL